MKTDRYRFKTRFLAVLREHDAWPTNTQQPTILRAWRGTGIKAPTYVAIKNGGSSTRRDIEDILQIFTRRAHSPFVESVRSYILECGYDPELISRGDLFHISTDSLSAFDWMKAGALSLVGETLNRILAPTDCVAAVRNHEDIRDISKWTRASVGRDLSKNESLTLEEGERIFHEHWKEHAPDFESKLERWHNRIPWSVILSCSRRGSHKNPLERSGGSVVLPLQKHVYDDVKQGLRHFDDIHPCDLISPSPYVYIYISSEKSERDLQHTTFSSLVALTYQISALTPPHSDLQAIAIAPQDRAAERLEGSKFKKVLVHREGPHRPVAIYERHASSGERIVLAAMREALWCSECIEEPPSHESAG